MPRYSEDSLIFFTSCLVYRIILLHAAVFDTHACGEVLISPGFYVKYKYHALLEIRCIYSHRVRQLIVTYITGLSERVDFDKGMESSTISLGIGKYKIVCMYCVYIMYRIFV